MWERGSPTPATRSPLPGYTTVDAMAYYRLGAWDVQLKLNNLFDHRYIVAGHGKFAEPEPAGCPAFGAGGGTLPILRSGPRGHARRSLGAPTKARSWATSGPERVRTVTETNNGPCRPVGSSSKGGVAHPPRSHCRRLTPGLPRARRFG